MNDAPADSAPSARLANVGWPPSKLIFFIALALAAHAGSLFFFGAKKTAAPRAVTRAPQFQIADRASELIALGDPTLFALPHANDFATAFWQRTPAVPPPDFRWQEPPRYLPPAAARLGTALAAFVESNPPAPFALNFTPPPPAANLSATLPPPSPAPATVQAAGGLAQRRWMNALNLPVLAYNDVLPPGRVQVLVDAAGNVISAVLLEPSGVELADTNALALARTARFAPAAELAFGELIFNWRTLPVAATNAVTPPSN